MSRSGTAADTRAAQAALNRPQDIDHAFDRYLLIDDTDDFTTEIQIIVRERSPRALEVLS